MTPVRSAARAMLAAIFVTEGVAALNDPERLAGKAKPVTDRIAALHPAIPSDPVTLVQANGALQVAGGALLAAGVATTPASLALAASLVPTTLAGHAFWQFDDPAERRQHRGEFFRNAAILGGLLFAALDHEGRPSLRWRAGHLRRRTAREARVLRHRTAHEARHLRWRAAHEAHHATGAARRLARGITGS